MGRIRHGSGNLQVNQFWLQKIGTKPVTNRERLEIQVSYRFKTLFFLLTGIGMQTLETQAFVATLEPR